MYNILRRVDIGWFLKTNIEKNPTFFIQFKIAETSFINKIPLQKCSNDQFIQ